MCYHNFVLHSGCGHIAESHSPWTLCTAAQTRLLSSRNGPLSPPLSAPIHPPKRSTTLSSVPSTKRRFFSFTRSSTSASLTSTSSKRRTVSGPASNTHPSSPESGFPSEGGSAAGFSYSAYEFENARCKGIDVQRRELTQSEATRSGGGKEAMRVCTECERWIHEMQFMIARWEKTGSIRGTGAFEEFLKERNVGERDLYREWGI